jgi:hypothetical protein
VSPEAAYAVGLALLFFGAVLVPWLAIRALVPTLAASDRAVVENYRGHRVAVGLGLVWIVWAIGLLAVGFIDSVYATLFSAEGTPLLGDFSVDVLPLLLVVGTLALGMADDAFGSSAEKGFRGHLSALFHGRLTTGALKLLGIGLLAAVSTVPDLGAADESLWAVAGLWALQVLAIALTANLLNLLDLRPGRALKAYSLLAFAGCVFIAAVSDWMVVPCVALILFGPVVATWAPDLGERGMLGDAGANAAGVLAGWLLATTFVEWWWALATYVVVVLALNVASERASFSSVIEATPFLRWLDGIGRVKETRVPSEARDR